MLDIKRLDRQLFELPKHYIEPYGDNERTGHALVAWLNDLTRLRTDYRDRQQSAIMRSIELCRVKQLRASQRQNSRHTTRSRTLHNNYSVFRNCINASGA